MWIARDADETLWGYPIKPEKDKELNRWIVPDNCSIQNAGFPITSNLFPEVKWEDSEPRELVLKPIKDEQGFVNLYKDGGQVKVGWKIFPTKKEAEENFKDDEKYITTANIQWRGNHDNL